MYRIALELHGSVTFAGPDRSWLRVDVLGITNAQVELGVGVEWPEGLYLRVNKRCARVDGFRVRALKFVGPRIQLGIDIPRGWARVRRDQPAPELALKERDSATPSSTGGIDGVLV